MCGPFKHIAMTLVLCVAKALIWQPFNICIGSKTSYIERKSFTKRLEDMDDSQLRTQVSKEP